MELLGNYFTYDNISSEIYDLKFISLNTSVFLGTGANSEITKYRIKNTNREIPTSYKYSESLSFEIEMGSNSVITDETHREIMNWLSNKLEYKKLYINSNYYVGVYLNCRFTNIEKIQNGINGNMGIVGYKLTLQCDAPWAWEDDYTQTFNSDSLSSTNNVYTLKINNKSDLQGYTYPTLELKLATGTKHFEMTNTSDNNRVTKIDYEETAFGIQDTETLTLNPEKLTITSSVGRTDSSVYKTFNKLFFRLIPKENTVEISSGNYVDNVLQTLATPFEIKITYRNARFI